METHSSKKFWLALICLVIAVGLGYWLGALNKGKSAATSSGQTSAASGERKVKYWKSPMDATYMRDAPGKDYMGHDMVPVYEGEAADSTGIAIDPVTIQNMGVRTATVSRRDLMRTIRAVGLITYDEQNRYSINSKIEGWIERLYVNQTGQLVKKGQPLMEIYSPELVAAQQEYLLALESSKRLSNSSLPSALEGSRRLLEAARTRLAYWDISDAQIHELEQTGQVRKLMTLYSPYSGVVTLKQANEGMRVMGGEQLLQISDISKIWINAEIYEYELPWVQPGQPAEVEIPFEPGKPLAGKIAYIYPYVQNETRTVKARIEFSNPGLTLKPEMYVNVLIQGRPVKGALAIPGDAVLNSGKGRTVFVALGEGRFDPRSVQTGISDEQGYVEVISGLREGEKVVTSAQFMLDSESNLREAMQKMMEAQSAPAAPKDNEDLFK
ncbi:MAG: efflux RND transporter periplasmic adaptor subunit [Desulfobacteraceae bacterium]|nr:efflux RND transporter periplasmic adaptor subunit [Desulfobacteraceae bacterium]